MHQAAREHGRDPSSLSATVMGAAEGAAGLANLGEEGVDRAVPMIWTEDRSEIL